MVKVVIVHSSALLRGALRTALMEAGDLRVVGEASRGEQALHLLEGAAPDVLVLACRLEGRADSATVAARVRALGRRIAVLAWGDAGGDRGLWRLWRAGAAGCVEEEAPPEALREAVSRAARGERLWTREQLWRAHSWWEQVGSRLARLSAREMQVLKLVAGGLTTRQIAQRLTLSHNTVEAHVRSVLTKLEVSSRLEAALLLVRELDAGGGLEAHH